jgi:ribosome-dependent ATPase
MNAGKVLACDEPLKLIAVRGAESLEEAFIGYMEDSIAAAAAGKGEDKAPVSAPAAEKAEPAPVHDKPSPWKLRFTRMLAYTRNETMQILRDPVRLAFAFVGSLLLMLVSSGSPWTSRISVMPHSISHPKAAHPIIRRSAAFFPYAAGHSATALKRLQSDEFRYSIPPTSAGISAGCRAGSLAVDWPTFRGDTVEQYVQGVHSPLRDPATAQNRSSERWPHRRAIHIKPH